MNRIEEILGKVGLTAQETRVYMALLELLEAQTGILCRHTRIASSNIYKVLDSLMGKGLASYRMQNNIKIFMPAPPETLNELFLDKQKKLEEERKQVAELISGLRKRVVVKAPYSNYKYYEGMNGVKAMWHELNSEMGADSVIRVYTGRKEGYEKLVKFFDEHHRLRREKGIREQMIFPLEDVKLAKMRRNKFTEVRMADLRNDAEWGIVKDVLYIHYVTGKRPRGFLIRDETFADTFKQVFDQVWKLAKPLGD